jgi:hypothetical protein
MADIDVKKYLGDKSLKQGAPTRFQGDAPLPGTRPAPSTAPEGEAMLHPADHADGARVGSGFEGMSFQDFQAINK